MGWASQSSCLKARIVATTPLTLADGVVVVSFDWDADANQALTQARV